MNSSTSFRMLKDYIDSILAPRGFANESATSDSHDAKIIWTFAVPDLDDASQLKAKGISIFSSPWQFLDDGLAGGVLSAYIHDPDGNTILLGRGSANELEQILS